MTKKKQRIMRMRMIRKATGLPLPVAAQLAKLKDFMPVPQSLKSFVLVEESYCSLCRDFHSTVTATGKKGMFKLF